MRNTNKKGFTIVELVVVVAVIAILAAVLIPTFSGIIAKANLSADQKAEQTMNTAIAMEGAETLEEALAALAKHNINADKLIPISAGYSFVWNKNSKQIELVEGKVNESVDEARKNIAVAVNTADAFVEAVNNGLKYIKLEADVTIDRDIIFEGENITLDLGGKKLTTTVIKNEGNPENEEHAYIRVYAGASVTITNGTFEGRGVMNYGDLVIDGATINAVDYTGGGCIRNKEGATVIVNSGTFKVENEGVYIDDENGGYYKSACAIDNAGGEVIINGGEFISEHNIATYLVNNHSGNITVNGGTFTTIAGLFNIKGGTVTLGGGTYNWTSEANGSQHMFYFAGASATLNINSGCTFNVDKDPASGASIFLNKVGATINGSDQYPALAN